MKIFCPVCSKHTEQQPVYNQLATECPICHSLVANMQRAETEANKFMTPAGSEATVVRNDDQIVFSIEQGTEAGYYVYDKKSGFGGVQKR
jgi:hypothetical protein